VRHCNRAAVLPTRAGCADPRRAHGQSLSLLARADTTQFGITAASQTKCLLRPFSTDQPRPTDPSTPLYGTHDNSRSELSTGASRNRRKTRVSRTLRKLPSCPISLLQSLANCHPGWGRTLRPLLPILPWQQTRVCADSGTTCLHETPLYVVTHDKVGRTAELPDPLRAQLARARLLRGEGGQGFLGLNATCGQARRARGEADGARALRDWPRGP
jgi:hypothetical protein